MLHFEEGACHVLAGDTRTAFADMDKAYLAGLRMAATIVETFHGSGLPVGQSQKVFTRMNQGLAHLVEGRGEIVSVVTHLHAIQARSDVAEVATGCPLPWDVMIARTKSSSPSVPAESA